jgi:putative ABC transport system substrate-binding protein
VLIFTFDEHDPFGPFGLGKDSLMVRRRDFIAGLGGAAAWSVAARAQQGGRVRRLGVLIGTPSGDPGGQAEVAAFIKALADLGWVEGRNITVAYRWSAADIALANSYAKELVALNPDILLARSTPPTVALKSATTTIPIVFVNVAEPVSSGIVPNLVRPGGNVTGFTGFEASIGGKWLQLLKEVDPRLVRIGIIYNPQTAPFAGLFLRSIEMAAPTLGVETIAMPVHSEADIATALTSLAQRPGSGLVQILDTYTVEHRDTIIALAARLRLSALYSNSIATRSGGLMAYAIDGLDQFQRAGTYVDRILKGAKPADLPVQQPTRFKLSINLKTAEALGLALPDLFVASADEVIE